MIKSILQTPLKDHTKKQEFRKFQDSTTKPTS